MSAIEKLQAYNESDDGYTKSLETTVLAVARHLNTIDVAELSGHNGDVIKKIIAEIIKMSNI